MAQKRDEIVNLLMWEIGKSLPDSEKEFDRTIDYVKDTIEALKELDRNSSRLVVEKGILAQIRRAPLGVVLCMGPYNYPLNETFTTLIPALIMGNTTIFKPAKMGVLLHLPLLEAFRDAFPPGVVNTVYGDGKSVVGPLMESGKVDSLAFIGSSRVANILKHQHPRLHRMKSVLGLDAKNAAIILPDSDLDLAVNEALLGSLSYNGQRCTALKILFVHRSVADKFNEKFCAKIEAMKIGMPWTDGVQITPLPEDGKASYLTDLIKDAEANGARVLNPSGGIFNETFFFPAVLYPVNEKMRVYSEEQFGPLVPVVPFDNIEEPLKYITDSNYGQQASIFGNDAEQISDLIDPLVNQLSRININSQCQRGPDTFPFTGRKDSAENTLSVSDALKVFSIRALVAAKLTDSNKTLINNILKNNKSNFLSTDFIL
jgi:glyceraldehyde-3-phosphate dehydrogenase (NADP+)